MTALDHIAEVIRRAMGVDMETMGPTALGNAVRSRVNARGVADAEAYRELLRGSGEELAELIELVVVPETWFFRAPQAFHALTSVAMREWLPANPMGTLRVLSAPCSTGEEPYSIAMALLDAGLPAERFRVTAVDISERALERARAATYGRNSFRGADLGFRARYFTPVAGGYRLNQSVRDCVELRRCNLVSDDPPADTGTLDAVFCRNVLIYFDAETQERVVRNLGRCLKPEGLLFVGPSETFVARAAGFSSADFPGAFACRRTEVKSAPPAAPKPAPSWTAPAPPLPPRAVKPAPPKTNTVRKPAPKETPAERRTTAPTPTGVLETANALANADRHPEALAACEAHLREHGPTAAAYSLLGLIRERMGDWTEAAEAYRKALFLNPAHHETLLLLAILLEKQGDKTGGGRLRARARRAREVVS